MFDGARNVIELAQTQTVRFADFDLGAGTGDLAREALKRNPQTPRDRRRLHA